MRVSLLWDSWLKREGKPAIRPMCPRFRDRHRQQFSGATDVERNREGAIMQFEVGFQCVVETNELRQKPPRVFTEFEFESPFLS